MPEGPLEGERRARPTLTLRQFQQAVFITSEFDNVSNSFDRFGRALRTGMLNMDTANSLLNGYRIEHGIPYVQRPPFSEMVGRTLREELAANPNTGGTQGRTEQEVRNTNLEQEGGTTMPEAGLVETVQIDLPLSQSARSQVFRWLNVADSLMNGMDVDTWTRQLRGLQEHLRPIRIEVRPNAYEIPVAQRAIEGIAVVQADYIPLETAREIIRVASNGCITLGDIERVQGERVHLLSPRSGLENAAWLRYTANTGSSYYVFPGGTEESSPSVHAPGLVNVMSTYRVFRSRHRAAYIREEIHARLGRRAPQDNYGRPARDVMLEEALKQERFEKYSRTLRARMDVQRDAFGLLPTLPRKTLASRRWGIEIEAVDIRGINTPEGWELKGDGSLRSCREDVSDYNDSYQDHDDWCASLEEDEDGELYENDCDCDSYYSRGQTLTGEWNSPILRSYHSRGLEYLCNSLEGRQTNKTAGVHVHVEASDLTPDQTVLLTSMYTALEPLFESEYAREERSYCQTVSVHEFFNRVRRVKDAKEKGIKNVRAVSMTSRYWTVNLASLSSHGTVEFRAMGPVYKYDHLTKWAYLCREMVNVARSNVPQKVWGRVRSMQDVITLFAQYGKETPTPSWAKDVPAKDIVKTLGTESRRKPNLKVTPLTGLDIELNPYGGSTITDVFEDYVGSTAFVPTRTQEDFLNCL